MVTYTDARDALVAHISARLAADKPALRVFYENTEEVDINAVGDQFMRVTIDFETAKQTSIELSPAHRVLGNVTFLIAVKTGRGTRTTLQLFDYIVSLMKAKTIGGVTTKIPTPGRKQSKDGWTSFLIHVPFTFDSIG